MKFRKESDMLNQLEALARNSFALDAKDKKVFKKLVENCKKINLEDSKKKVFVASAEYADDWAERQLMLSRELC